jgi:predicted dienelactone hydrolase
MRAGAACFALVALLPLLGACAGAGGAPAGLAAAAPVKQTDPAAPVQSLDLDWRDAARDRPVPVRLYLPGRQADRDADAAVRLPLVVFSHGLGGSRAGYGHLGRHWAAQGIASLHVQHAGSDRAIWTAGGPLGLPERLRSAISAENAVARARDVSFAIDRLLGDPVLGARLDRERIAVAGHSFGANTALLVAGAGAATATAPAALRDPRVRAAVLMSAPPFPARFDTREVLSGIAIPTLHLTTVDDVSVVPGLATVARDRIALYEAMDAVPRWLAVFAHGAHGVFTDHGDDERSQAVKQATRDLSTGFLRATLDASAGELARAFDAHASLLARRESKESAPAPARPR